MEDYCTYEQSVLLKEFGFDGKCYTWYHWDNWCGLTRSGMYENHNMFEKCISAPTLAQVQKWLREVKQIEVWVEPSEIIDDKNPHQSSYDYWPYVYDKTSNRKYEYLPIGAKFEDALSKGIDQALQILTDKTKEK